MRPRGPAVAALIAGVLLAGATCFGIAATPAAAAPAGLELDVNGSGFTAAPTTPLLGVSGLVPGSVASGVLGIRNDTADPGSVTIRIVSPASSENGCTPAELALDPGCDPTGAGQLPDHLLFGLAASPDGGKTYDPPLWTGTVAQLESGVEAIASLGGGGVEWLQVSAALPIATGNETQSDTFAFGLAVTLAGAGGGGPIIPPSGLPTVPTGSGAGVGGVSTGRSAPPTTSTVTVPPGHGVGGQSSGEGLASTGIPVLALITAGVLLLASGGLLAVTVRLRRSGRREN